MLTFKQSSWLKAYIGSDTRKRSLAGHLRLITLFVVHTRKVGLTAFDTKQWLCEDTVHTDSHGHKDTVSNPSDLLTNSYIVRYFTNVGIFSHNDLPGKYHWLRV